VWDLETGELRRALTGHRGYVHAMGASADGRRAVSGDDDGTVRVWDLEAGQLRSAPTGQFGYVHAVGVSADGRRAVSGGEDGTVRVWGLEAGELRHALTGHDVRVQTVGVSADGRRAFSRGFDGTVRVWDIAMGKQIASLSQRPTSWLLRLRLQQCRIVMSLSVSVDGRRAVSVGNDSNPFRGGDGRVWVWVWDLEAGKRLHTLTGDVGSTGAVAVIADGRRAVSGGKDGRCGCGTWTPGNSCTP